MEKINSKIAKAISHDKDRTRSNLEKETKKWLERIEKEIEHFDLVDKNNKEHQRMLKNIHAYVSDCKHFMKKDDMIRAFEAVIWAWAWLEILRDLGMLAKK
jgi:hypothetical protein